MNTETETSGWIFGISAFLIWGFLPIYFKYVSHVSAEEILAHRIVWCVPFTLLFMLMLKKRLLLASIIKDKKLFFGLIVSTLLITCNWYVFTWAVTHGQILSTSLGYFINPIFSILLGVIFLSESLSKFQWAAVVLVSLGVLNQIINYGEIPWAALTLATSFALYGFMRKKLAVDSLNGLLVETLIAFPFALAYIIWQIYTSQAVFLNYSSLTDVLLIAGGIITAVPLILFAAAAKKIPLNSIGFLQFIAPSISFVIATQYYNEHLGTEQLMSFVLIWIGLSMYLVKPMRAVFGRRTSRS
ncbi:MAG: protein RarD [Gammaproteobacteria bacterium]|nr:MAG: protein RarD [Gammaproteobacteria bacterium]